MVQKITKAYLFILTHGFHQVEEVAVNEAKVVAKELTTKTSADAKNIVHDLAKETVDEAKEKPSTILKDLEEGVEAIAEDVEEGATKVVEQVEEHPELLAE